MSDSNTVFSFGIANEVNSKLTTVSLCATVIFVNLFEHLTRLLEHSVSHSYIYNRMLQRIYMELMSTGFTSILIAMYRAGYPTLEATDLLLSMDFAGYFIFFISIFHVIHGIYIIALSLFTTKEYDVLHCLPTLTLLKDYKTQIQTSKIYSFFYSIQWSPVSLSTARKQFEFKILFSLFRHTYWLPVNFHYGLYLSQCFERYSERIMVIGPTGWILLLIGIVLNYLRTSYGTSNTMNCSGIFSSSSEELNSHEKRHERDRCDWLQLRLFCVYGVCMAGYILVIFVIGRIYVLRLIQQAGVTTSGEEYEEFLLLEESTLLKTSKQVHPISIIPEDNASPVLTPQSSSTAIPVRKRTMSFATLRNNIQKMLRQESDEKNLGRQSNISIVPVTSSKLVHSNTDDRRVAFASGGNNNNTNTKDNKDNKDSNISINKNNSNQPNQLPNSMTSKPRRPIQSFLLVNQPLDPSKKQINSANLLDREEGKAHIELNVIEQFKMKRLERDHGRRTGVISEHLRNVVAESINHNISRDSSSKEHMKVSEDFSHIYFFRSPMLYFRAVEAAIVLNSIYLSLWLINFITVCARVAATPRWQIVMILPLLVAVPVIGEIVKTASLLSAIAELNVSVMGSVLEEMDDRKKVLSELRENVKDRLEEEDSFNQKVFLRLFSAQCEENTKSLNKAQFRCFLTSLRLPYSDNRFRRVFRALDESRLGVITYHALYAALFPEQADEENLKARNESLAAHQQHPSSSSSSSSLNDHSHHLNNKNHHHLTTFNRQISAPALMSTQDHQYPSHLDFPPSLHHMKGTNLSQSNLLPHFEEDENDESNSPTSSPHNTRPPNHTSGFDEEKILESPTPSNPSLTITISHESRDGNNSYNNGNGIVNVNNNQKRNIDGLNDKDERISKENKKVNFIPNMFNYLFQEKKGSNQIQVQPIEESNKQSNDEVEYYENPSLTLERLRDTTTVIGTDFGRTNEINNTNGDERVVSIHSFHSNED